MGTNAGFQGFVEYVYITITILGLRLFILGYCILMSGVKLKQRIIYMPHLPLASSLLYLKHTYIAIATHM